MYKCARKGQVCTYRKKKRGKRESESEVMVKEVGIGPRVWHDDTRREPSGPEVSQSPNASPQSRKDTHDRTSVYFNGETHTVAPTQTATQLRT